MFSLESPYRGDSYEYTQHTIFNVKRKKTPLLILSLPRWDIFQGTSLNIRVISVRATEVKDRWDKPNLFLKRLQNSLCF